MVKVNLAYSMGRFIETELDSNLSLRRALCECVSSNNIEITKVVHGNTALPLDDPIPESCDGAYLLLTCRPIVPRITSTSAGPSEANVKELTMRLRRNLGLPSQEEKVPSQRRATPNGDLVHAILSGSQLMDFSAFQDLLRSGMVFRAPVEEETDGHPNDESREEELMDLVKIPADKIVQLTELGFTELQAKRGLLLNRLDSNRAAEYLFERSADQPLNRSQCAQLRRTYHITQQQIDARNERRAEETHDQEAAGGAQEEYSSPEPETVVALSEPELTAEEMERGEKVAFLVQMGFNPGAVAEVSGDIESMYRTLIGNPESIIDVQHLRNTVLNFIAEFVVEGADLPAEYSQLLEHDSEDCTPLLASPAVVRAVGQAFNSQDDMGDMQE